MKLLVVVVALAACVSAGVVAPAPAPVPTGPIDVSPDFKVEKSALAALQKLIQASTTKFSPELQIIAKDETKELEGDDIKNAGEFFIYCHPTPVGKDSKMAADCASWAKVLKDSFPKFDKFIKLLDAPDEVDSKTSARHEKVSERMHFKLHPEEKEYLKTLKPVSDAEEKEAQDKEANSKPVLVELPMFVNNQKWPKDGNVYPVAFCFAGATFAAQKAFFYKAMRRVAAVANHIRFRQVKCNAPGHKIKMGYVKGSCATQGGGYNGNGNPTAGTAGAVGKPATNQYIECDRKSFNAWSGAHELFHALGFGHTQCRAGRGRYLDVQLTGNADDDYQYRIIGNNRGRFDFDSIMLYPPDSPGDPKPTAWARNPTPVGYTGPVANMGQRDHISAEDATILNTVYN